MVLVRETEIKEEGDVTEKTKSKTSELSESFTVVRLSASGTRWHSVTWGRPGRGGDHSCSWQKALLLTWI